MENPLGSSLLFFSFLEGDSLSSNPFMSAVALSTPSFPHAQQPALTLVDNGEAFG